MSDREETNRTGQASERSFDFGRYQFAAVIELPDDYDIYDFSQGYDSEFMRRSVYGVGKYNDRRPGMYTSELFGSDPAGSRDIHIGIDIAAPVLTPVHAIFEGTVHATKIHLGHGNYGGTVITKHVLRDAGGNIREFWALYGHLSHASVDKATLGSKVHAGDILGWLGDESENGGWNPHLHFQLSWREPENCDMPGVVNEKDLAHALKIYPDPRLVLGPLY